MPLSHIMPIASNSLRLHIPGYILYSDGEGGVLDLGEDLVEGVMVVGVVIIITSSSSSGDM